MVSTRVMMSASPLVAWWCSLKASMNLSRDGGGLTSLDVLRCHILASPLSMDPAKRVWNSAEICARSIYSSMLKAQAVVVASERSVPSNLSGFGILIFSDMFRDVSVCLDVSVDVDVDVGVCVGVGVCVCVDVDVDVDVDVVFSA